MKIIITIISIFLILGGITYSVYQQKQPSLITTFVYPEPKSLPEFELMDQYNQPFNNQQLVGKWSVVFFGYTNCPDICPTTLSALTQVANKLQPDILSQVQFIFVSVDPERDTVQHLAEYVPFFHPDFIGVTGEDEQLQILSYSLGAMYMKVDTEDSYQMTHSSTLFIINPQGRRHGIFSNATQGIIDVKSITSDLDTIVRFQ